MNKTLIPVGIAAVVVAISIGYGAVANPGGEPSEEEPSSEVWNFRFSGKEFHNDKTNVFVCKNFSCSLPLHDLTEIEKNL